MKLTVQTLTASAAVHVALVALLVVRFLSAPEPDSDALMDVCAIDLSLSDSEDESQPETVAPEPPSLAEPAPPRAETPLPEAPRLESSRPPEVPCADVRPLPPAPDSLRVDPPESEVAQLAEAAPMQEAVSAPQQARVDAPPRPLMTIRPVYPRGARRRGEQGNVSLDIRVDETGEVGQVRVASSSGFAELDAAAADAVRAARFEPARSGGLVVASTARLMLSFRLR